MAIPWLVVLQSVPWSDVIRNAPKVAEGAKKLWNAVAQKPTLPKPPAFKTQPGGSDSPMAGLAARVASLESALSDLHQQMLASSEVIKALADQNTQLVRRVEANRLRVVWLTRIAALVAIVVLAGWLVR
jgi:hypothetical protein